MTKNQANLAYTKGFGKVALLTLLGRINSWLLLLAKLNAPPGGPDNPKLT